MLSSRSKKTKKAAELYLTVRENPNTLFFFFWTNIASIRYETRSRIDPYSCDLRDTGYSASVFIASSIASFSNPCSAIPSSVVVCYRSLSVHETCLSLTIGWPLKKTREILSYMWAGGGKLGANFFLWWESTAGCWENERHGYVCMCAELSWEKKRIADISDAKRAAINNKMRDGGRQESRMLKRELNGEV